MPGEPLEDGEELTFDKSAYKMYHAVSVKNLLCLKIHSVGHSSYKDGLLKEFYIAFGDRKNTVFCSCLNNFCPQLWLIIWSWLPLHHYDIFFPCFLFTFCKIRFCFEFYFFSRLISICGINFIERKWCIWKT